MQVGYKVRTEYKLKKPEVGHCVKAGVPPLKHLKEWRIATAKAIEQLDVGTRLQVQHLFKAGDHVDVAGTSSGKGFQGAIKRWDHSRGPMTHGALFASETHTCLSAKTECYLVIMTPAVPGGAQGVHSACVSHPCALRLWWNLSVLSMLSVHSKCS